MKMIDFEVMKDFPGKKESIKDIYKVMAFQFGQLFSLVDGFEKDSYTKSGLIQNYPDLAPMLRREELSEKDYKTLNIYLDRLIKLSELRVDKMRDDLRKSGIYEKATIKGWMDANRHKEEGKYAKAFYWTLLNYLDSYRAASTGIL